MTVKDTNPNMYYTNEIQDITAKCRKCNRTALMLEFTRKPFINLIVKIPCPHCDEMKEAVIIGHGIPTHPGHYPSTRPIPIRHNPQVSR